MKKIIIAAIVSIVLIAGLLLVKNRMSSTGSVGGGDLVIVNDSPDTASSAFTRDGKIISQVMHSGEKTSGGRGLIRIFIAKKNGAYEIEYAYPRPAGKPSEILLSQIIDVARRTEMNDELITQKGMIDDIRVDYEEVREFD